MNDYIIELRLRRPYGKKSSVVRFPADEAFAELVIPLNVRPPCPYEVTKIDDVIDIMRKKVIRKERLADLCVRMGHLLAERLEDEEGWHGLDRQQRCLELLE